MRSLYEGFRRFRGTSPMEFLRTMRLRRVREDLIDAPAGTTVSDVATRWGFYQFGRFAAQYRQLFGETPSATLRRALVLPRLSSGRSLRIAAAAAALRRDCTALDSASVAKNPLVTANRDHRCRPVGAAARYRAAASRSHSKPCSRIANRRCKSARAQCCRASACSIPHCRPSATSGSTSGSTQCPDCAGRRASRSPKTQGAGASTGPHARRLRAIGRPAPQDSGVDARVRAPRRRADATRCRDRRISSSTRAPRPRHRRERQGRDRLAVRADRARSPFTSRSARWRSPTCAARGRRSRSPPCRST